MREYSVSRCGNSMQDADKLELSIICPFHNEADSLETLIPKLLAVEDSIAQPVEVILCDDGSTDASRAIALKYQKQFPLRCRVIAADSNQGQSRAWEAGIAFSRAPLVAFVDADGQNPPEEIAGLVAKLSPELSFVKGYRQHRRDTLFRQIASWCGNHLLGHLFGVSIRDAGCSLAVYRIRDISGYDFSRNLHRYIPVLLARAGASFVEVPVRHLARRSGRSHYSLVRKVLQVPAEIRYHLHRNTGRVIDTPGLSWFREIGG